MVEHSQTTELIITSRESVCLVELKVVASDRTIRVRALIKILNKDKQTKGDLQVFLMLEEEAPIKEVVKSIWTLEKNY
jgi:hypothetical protein